MCPKSELSSCVKEGPAPSKLISAGTKRRSLVCYQGNKISQRGQQIPKGADCPPGTWTEAGGDSGPIQTLKKDELLKDPQEK